eukprot:sb/3472544/
MPLFSKKKKLEQDKMIKPQPRQNRSVSLFQKLERRNNIVKEREGDSIEPVMEVFNPLIEFKDIPRAEIAKYEEVFNEFDADGNGMLTIEEIKGAMRKLGTVMTHMQFKDILTELDADGNNELDLREINSLCTVHIVCILLPSTKTNSCFVCLLFFLLSVIHKDC